MCSIIGYLGPDQAAPVLVRGLRRMEYRGYDSVGVATKTARGVQVRKGVGRVAEVNGAERLDEMGGSVGIGHTRWATHGGVTGANAHPHPSSSGAVAVVHNGTIDNFAELKAELLADGYTFRSETDTEVISNLLQKSLGQAGGSTRDAMALTVARLRGRYAFVALFGNGTLAAARFHRPLIVGVGRGGAGGGGGDAGGPGAVAVAGAGAGGAGGPGAGAAAAGEGPYLPSSDVMGFIEQTDDAVYVDNGHFVTIDRSGMRAYSFDGAEASYAVTKVSREFADAYKGDYAHYTLKEISEQPDTIVRAGTGGGGGAAGSGGIAGGGKKAVAEAAALLRACRDGGRSVYVTGSGTSYNAALVARHVLSKRAGLRAEPVMSSEMPHWPEPVPDGSALLALSQSGESADVIEAAEMARRAGASVVSIVNLTASSLAQESSVVIGMNCGPEIGVAATKSFTSQLAVIHGLADEIAGAGEGEEGGEGGGAGRFDPAAAADAISSVLSDHARIRELAARLKDVSDIYVLGRGVHYPIAAEAALKIKELTYIHAEGMAGGELKHGPLALIDSSVYVIVINPGDSTFDDMVTGAREIKARGARIIGVSDSGSDVYDHWVRIPRMADEAAYPAVEIVPLQLLAYYLALERDTDPDHPRNLAKSVTVK